MNEPNYEALYQRERDLRIYLENRVRIQTSVHEGMVELVKLHRDAADGLRQDKNVLEQRVAQLEAETTTLKAQLSPPLSDEDPFVAEIHRPLSQAEKTLKEAMTPAASVAATVEQPFPNHDAGVDVPAQDGSVAATVAQPFPNGRWTTK